MSIAQPPQGEDLLAVRAWAGLLSDDFKMLIADIEEIPIPEGSELDVYRLTDSLDEVKAGFDMIEDSTDLAITSARERDLRIGLQLTRDAAQGADEDLERQEAEATDLSLEDCAIGLPPYPELGK